MTQHQGTMEWGPHMDPTPLCLRIVPLLCSVSVRITPLNRMWIHEIRLNYNLVYLHFFFKFLSLLKRMGNLEKICKRGRVWRTWHFFHLFGWQILLECIFFFFFFWHVYIRGGWRIRTSDLRFMRRGLQSIELLPRHSILYILFLLYIIFKVRAFYYLYIN